MEKYIVDITDDALDDMDALYEHIATKLQAPEHRIFIKDYLSAI